MISVVKLGIPSRKLANDLNLLVSRFVVPQSLKQESADAQSSLFRKKNCKPRDKLSLNGVFCDFIAHLTLMRKVLMTRNSSQTTRRSPPGRVDGRAHRIVLKFRGSLILREFSTIRGIIYKNF